MQERDELREELEEQQALNKSLESGSLSLRATPVAAVTREVRW